MLWLTNQIWQGLITHKPPQDQYSVPNILTCHAKDMRQAYVVIIRQSGDRFTCQVVGVI